MEKLLSESCGKKKKCEKEAPQDFGHEKGKGGSTRGAPLPEKKSAKATHFLEEEKQEESFLHKCTDNHRKRKERALSIGKKGLKIFSSWAVNEERERVNCDLGRRKKKGKEGTGKSITLRKET